MKIMNELNIGQIIKGEQFRDAIHIAVAPVEAAERLSVGDHVGLKNGKATMSADPVGIVDPYLQNPVNVGQKFWLFLYPKTVTNLRHEWHHPAFSGSQLPSKESKAESEKWLRDFCAEHDRIDYEDMLDALKRDGGYVIQYGSESARSLGVTAEFQHHFKVVTGKEAIGFFSCSC